MAIKIDESTSPPTTREAAFYAQGGDLYLIVDTQSHSWFYSTWKLSKQYVCVLECFSSLECLPGTFEMFNFLTANLFNTHFPTQPVAIIVQCIVHYGWSFH